MTHVLSFLTGLRDLPAIVSAADEGDTVALEPGKLQALRNALAAVEVPPEAPIPTAASPGPGATP